jgi:hypothetical protein
MNQKQIPLSPIVWGTFFLIAFGLGYPTLNRYDPRRTGGLRDSVEYYKLVVSTPGTVNGHFRYRVLVPGLAKPLYHAVKGRLGSWDPALFSLLVVNAAFCATSALLILHLCSHFLAPAAAALSALLFLANFSISNFQLSGLVDSAECWALLAFATCLMRHQWTALPLIGVLAAMAKETSLPVGAVFACTWLLVERKQTPVPRRAWLSLVTMCAAALGTLLIVRSLVDGRPVPPWEIITAERLAERFSTSARGGLVSAVTSFLQDSSFWLVFSWILPLGALGWRLIPRPWIVAAGTSAACALALGIWSSVGGNVARPMFNAAGPALSAAAAAWIARRAPEGQRGHWPEGRGSPPTGHSI